MSARRERSHSAKSARDGSLESSYRLWKAQRPELFRQRSQPNTTPMETSITVHIAVIADNQDHLVSLPQTLYDPSQPRSLISKAKALATSGRITPCSPFVVLQPPKTTSTTTNNNSSSTSHPPLSSSATITLRWRYGHGLQSFQETFWIIDAATVAGYDAILRGNIEVTPAEGALPQANPIYVGTPGRSGRSERDKREEEKKRKEREYHEAVERQREKVRAQLDGKGRR